MNKLVSLVLSVIMFLCPSLNIPHTDADASAASGRQFVFVNGLGGWGEYQLYYKILPYWGVFGGDCMTYLRARGFDVHAASASSSSSAWDRACEVYAQLTGTTVDYGEAHSERYGHDRFGKCYRGRALVKQWDADHPIDLLGHSFGGATVLMLLDLMIDGSEEERAKTPPDGLSPLFAGGHDGWISSITALSAPLNGTTAYYAA
ncbi:MAG: lipase, partial [Clostridia bacterium]|nr:lipase [Clostridia bacterium]